MCITFHEAPSRNRRAGRRGFWCAGMAANKLCLGHPQHSQDSVSQDGRLLGPNGNCLYLAWDSCVCIDTTPFLICSYLSVTIIQLLKAPKTVNSSFDVQLPGPEGSLESSLIRR